jgi:ABC-type transporter Mla subunit MlaD
MDERDQQRINEAAQQFSDALVQSSRAAADRGMAALEMNAQLTGDFFKRVIENLRTQAEDTRQMGQELADQQQRAAEAGRTLTQESVRAYTDFVNSMFSFAQGSSTQEAPQKGGPRASRDFEGRFTRGEEAWEESEHQRDARGRFT